LVRAVEELIDFVTAADDDGSGREGP
jgi:hypothetical protein